MVRPLCAFVELKLQSQFLIALLFSKNHILNRLLPVTPLFCLALGSLGCY